MREEASFTFPLNDGSLWGHILQTLCWEMDLLYVTRTACDLQHPFTHFLGFLLRIFFLLNDVWAKHIFMSMVHIPVGSAKVLPSKTKQ